MNVEREIAAMKAEIQLLRDKDEIRRLLTMYAFNADVGRADDYVAGWAADGVYDVSEDLRVEGHDALRDFVAAPDGFHKVQIENRSQHLVANLIVEVEDDEAWAEGYSVVTLLKDGEVRIFAAGYNHWDFVRQHDRWLIKRRKRRVIGGLTWGGDVLTRYLEMPSPGTEALASTEADR